MKNGKRTMAVRLGQRKAKHYHFALLGLALVSFGAFTLLIQEKLVRDQPAILLLSTRIVHKHGKAVWETEKISQQQRSDACDCEMLKAY